MNQVPKSELDSRLKRIRKAMVKKRIGVLFVSYRGAKDDFFYLLGYTPLGDAAFILPLEQDPVLFVSTAWDFDRTQDTVYIQDLRLSSDPIGDTCVYLSDQATVGIARWETIPVDIYKRASLYLPDNRIKDASGIMREVRLIHSEWEISCHRRAVHIADVEMTRVADILREGVSEKELAREAKIAMLSEGAHGFSDPCIGSGARTAQPLNYPTQRIVRRKDLVVVDLGAIYNGYHSDICRTFVVGGPSRDQEKWISMVKQVLECLIDEVRPGILTHYLQNKAYQIFDKAGYGGAFFHHIGHGLGLNPGDLLNFQRDNIELKPGMIFTLEPGIYFPGIGGVRIEDDILLTSSGALNLTKIPRDLKGAM